MGSNTPRDWREYRRFRAFELSEEGWGVTRIAKALGVTKGAVSGWLSRARERGKKALVSRKAPGPTPKLPEEELERLPEFLKKGPQTYGFCGEVWTCLRVREVIRREFGVQYSSAHVSRLLKRLGWSPQKPMVKATQRDEAAIQKWREERWPVLKKRPSLKVERSPLLTKPHFISCLG